MLAHDGGRRGDHLMWLLAASFVVAGCTGSQDPSRAGFFDGVRNLSDGTYDARAVEQGRQLERLNELRGELRQNLETNQAAIARQNAEIAEMITRLARTDAELAQLERQLAEARRRAPSPEALRAAETRLAELRRRQRDLRAAPAPTTAQADALDADLRSMALAMARLGRAE